MEKSPSAKEVRLITVRNDIQAALVENLLKEQGIHCAKRHLSLGAVASLYTGMSNLGLDIFVNELDYEAAKEAVKVYESGMPEEEVEKQALESAGLQEVFEEEATDEGGMKMQEEHQPERPERKGRKSQLPPGFIAVLLLLLLLMLIMRYFKVI